MSLRRRCDINNISQEFHVFNGTRYLGYLHKINSLETRFQLEIIVRASNMRVKYSKAYTTNCNT